MRIWNFLITLGNKLAAVFLSSLVIFSYPLCVPAADDVAERKDASIVLEPPVTHPRAGERLGFHGRWFGIPVGHGFIEVKEQLIEFDGRKAYHIHAEGRTNDVLSTFYPIEDKVDSYLDAETLRPLRFEKHQREGHYRADEEVVFDYQARKATYHSLLNGSVKEIPLPEEFQDLISALYWFRSQPLKPGQDLNVNIYTDEKIFETVILVKSPAVLELRKRGSFPAIVVEPKAKFKGFLVKRGRIWAYLTADSRRLPVYIKASTPWGAMSVVLDQESIR